MPRITPKAFRTVTGVAFGSLCVIVVSGALVRLTGSGLGCSDWPQCNETKFVDVSSGHTLIEQANRLFTGVVSASVIIAVLMAHLVRPKRRDLIVLAWSLVVGVIAQIVIGGIVVLTGLNPYANMAHFLVSMILVACSYTLMRRSHSNAQTPILRTLPPSIGRSAYALVPLAIAAIVSGTVVTATGPHAGGEDAVRFGFELTTVARIHSIVVLSVVALVIFITISLFRTRADTEIRDSVQALLFATVIQAAIGYTQYFTGVPAAIVGAHIVGVLFFFVATLNIIVYPRT